MIADLDDTIAALLRGSLPAELVKNLSISFAPPDDRFPPTGLKLPAVDFFLFLIEENRELRNREPTHERQEDGRVVQRPAPVRVDCHYLVTAFAESVQKPEEDEHRILGEVLRVLVRHRQIPREFLKGEMAIGQPPLRAAAILPSPNHSPELWQALKGRPRASLHYVLTISVETGLPIMTLPAVSQAIFGGTS